MVQRSASAFPAAGLLLLLAAGCTASGRWAYRTDSPKGPVGGSAHAMNCYCNVEKLGQGSWAIRTVTFFGWTDGDSLVVDTSMPSTGVVTIDMADGTTLRLDRALCARMDVHHAVTAHGQAEVAVDFNCALPQGGRATGNVLSNDCLITIDE